MRQIIILLAAAVIPSLTSAAERVEAESPERALSEAHASSAQGIAVSLWGTDWEVGAAPLTLIEEEAARLLGPRVSLREISRESSLTIDTIRFRQFIDGVEVVDGDGVIRLDREGRVVGLNVNLARPGSSLASLRAVEGVTRREAGLEEEKVWLNLDGLAVPALRIASGPASRRELEILVDGRVVRSEADYYEKSARIFRANPVTVLNDPSLEDQDDSAEAVPSAAYEEVDLEVDDEGFLANSRVRIEEFSDPVTDSADSRGSLLFDRSEAQFEEVMAFHHVNEALEYVESLGFTGTRSAVQKTIRIDAHGSSGADNSFYSKDATGSPTLVFGDGGVDDAEDPDIIFHELGHVIHDGLAPSALSGGPATESRALSEGFSDYWAFTMGWSESVRSGRDPACVGDWDARCGSGASTRCAYPAGADCLRRVDSVKTMSDFESGGSGTEHSNGMIWASALREILISARSSSGEIGRRAADRMILEGLAGLPFRASFSDAANRLLEADEALTGGGMRTTICQALTPRGIAAAGCPGQFDGRLIYLPQRSGGFSLPAGAEWRMERFVSFDGSIDDLVVRLKLVQSEESRAWISLVSPEGETVSLTGPSGIAGTIDGVFGLNIPSVEPLTRLHGEQAFGTWVLTGVVSERDAELKEWDLGIAIEGSEPVDRSVAGELRTLIPAVASTAGARGTRYVTDLTLFNHGERDGLTRLIFTPAAEPHNPRIVSLMVSPLRTVNLQDVVRTLFDSTGIGSLEIHSEPGILANSRTYNDASTGTFGLSIGPYRETSMTGGPLYIPGLRDSVDYRSNAGIVETSGEAAVAELELLGEDGEILGSKRISLKPWQLAQFSVGSIAGPEGFSPATAMISRISDTGELAAYGSVIDNRTGDSTYVPAEHEQEIARSALITVAAHLDGARSSKWRTDLVLFNPADESIETVMELRLWSGGETIAVPVVLGPKQTRLFEDVVSTRFGVERGWGQIAFSEGLVIVSSRTWNDHGEGTFGQFIGPEYPDHTFGLGSGSTYAVGAVISEEYRTNIGMAETEGDFGAFRISVLGPEGRLLCRRDVGLAPYEAMQRSLTDIGCAGLAIGTVRVEHLSGMGRAVGWLSVIDNVSGDPTYIPIRTERGDI